MPLTRLTPLPPRATCALWLIDLDAPLVASEANLLADDEKARASRFAFARERHRFTAARSALRQVLGQCIGDDPTRLRFAYGASGKPGLAGTGRPAFNLSHSGHLGLLAVDGTASAAIGIDVELLRDVPDAIALAEVAFEPEERRQLAAVARPLRSAAFLAGWTRREACLKAAGTGFSGAPAPATGFTMGRASFTWPDETGLPPATVALDTFVVADGAALASLAQKRSAPAPRRRARAMESLA